MPPYQELLSTNRPSVYKVRTITEQKYRERLNSYSLERLRIHYSSGWCGVMAETLRQLTGWPIHIVMAGDYAVSAGRSSQLGAPHPTHAVVRDDEGRMWDAYGPRSDDAIITWYSAHWMNVSIEPWRGGEPIFHPYGHPFPRPRNPEYYEWCRQDHVPRLLPDLRF